MQLIAEAARSVRSDHGVSTPGRFVAPEIPAAPDDPGVGRILIFVVALLFMGVLRLSTANFDNVAIPFFGGGEPANPALASAAAIGTPAAVALPESDPASWFGGAEETEAGETTPWADIHQFVAAAGTSGGWAEACKAVGTVAGTDRTANSLLGALACSDDPTVTELQQFAVQLLAAQAEVSLWLLGTDGHDAGAVAGRLAQVRHSCANGLPARQAGAESAYTSACEMSLAVTTLPGDASTLATALGDAYALVAADLAERDPSIDPEPPAITAPATDATADAGADDAATDAGADAATDEADAGADTDAAADGS
jgi:hypothetical protein